MKIDIYVQNYPPEQVAVYYTSDLALALGKIESNNVRVFTALPHAPHGKAIGDYGVLLPHHCREENIEVWRLPIVMAANHQLWLRLLGFASFMLTSFLAGLISKRPDVMLVSLPSIFIWPSCLLVAKLKGIPTILLLRDVEPDISLRIRKKESTWWGKLSIKCWNWLYSAADEIVLVHNSQLESLPSKLISSHRPHIIDHGVDISRFEAVKTFSDVQLPKRNPDDLIFLYTGTFGVAQDLVTFIKMLNNHAVNALPISFLLVGDGEQKPEIEALIRNNSVDNVFLLDPVAREEIPKLLLNADILLMSYCDSEKSIPGMIGSKFYEYCAAGKPIIVHGDGMATSIVSDIGNGWVTPNGNEELLAQTLLEILQSKHLHQFIGDKGRAHATNHYSKTRSHKLWIKLLSKYSRQKPSPV